MWSKRKKEYRYHKEFLRDYMNESCSKGAVNERINWLLDHLKEYLERFFGFAHLHDSDTESLFGGQAWLSVVIAIECIDEEKNGCSNDAFMSCWDNVRSSIHEIRGLHKETLLEREQSLYDGIADSKALLRL